MLRWTRLLAACLLTLIFTSASLSTAGPLLGTGAAPPLQGMVALQPANHRLGKPTLAPPPPNPAPFRLLIPGIGVDASVEARGLDAQRNLATPLDFNNVAWYNQGPPPGQPGNAIINGHINWWTGSAVFTRLGELRPGDSLTVIRRDGDRVNFKVSGVRILAATARDASLFAPSAVPTLTLITCTGPWDLALGTDVQRLLVSAAVD